MYRNFAILAVFLLLYSTVAGAVDRSWISGPDRVHGGRPGPRARSGSICFARHRRRGPAPAGRGDAGDGAVHRRRPGDLGVVRRNIRLPERLLLIGLPLTILLGFGVALARVSRSAASWSWRCSAPCWRRPMRRLAGRWSTNAAVPAAHARIAQPGERAERRHLRAGRGDPAGACGRHADRGRCVVARRARGRRGDRHRPRRRPRADVGRRRRCCAGARARGWISEGWTEVPAVALAGGLLRRGAGARRQRLHRLFRRAGCWSGADAGGQGTRCCAAPKAPARRWPC